MTLHDYCVKKGVSFAEFSRLCGISESHFARIKNDRSYNLEYVIQKKIYNATLREYGEGLLPQDYLEF